MYFGMMNNLIRSSHNHLYLLLNFSKSLIASHYCFLVNIENINLLMVNLFPIHFNRVKNIISVPALVTQSFKFIVLAVEQNV